MYDKSIRHLESSGYWVSKTIPNSIPMDVLATLNVFKIPKVRLENKAVKATTTVEISEIDINVI